VKGPHDRLIQGGPRDRKDKAAERLRQFEQARRRSSETPDKPPPADGPSPKDDESEGPCEDRS
jgi:hypothetical protein